MFPRIEMQSPNGGLAFGNVPIIIEKQKKYVIIVRSIYDPWCNEFVILVLCS